MPEAPKDRTAGQFVRQRPLLRGMASEVAYYREHRPTFGPYLRALRENRGLSLRDAADQLCLNFSKLQKMETGGRFRIESLDLFANIADLYGESRQDVLASAGIKVLESEEIAEQFDDERAFARLVLHPELRPLGMDERWLDSFSTLQKKQWVGFARRLAAYLQNTGTLEDILNVQSA